jgi:uncharacterized membrane protein YeaQ/YmgE (transglycosylase-associated protein family)
MGIMSIIGLIIVGFIVGMLARFFYPGAVNLGFWMTALLGIGGSLVGGVATGLVWKTDGGFHRAGWIMSILARWHSSGCTSTSDGNQSASGWESDLSSHGSLTMNHGYLRDGLPAPGRTTIRQR